MAATPRGLVTDQITGVAGFDFSNAPYRIVKRDGSGVVTPMTVRASSHMSGVFGIIETQVASGENVSVALRGQPYVWCSTAIAALSLITASTSAGAQAAVSGDIVVAKAIEAAVADQYLAVILVDPFRLGE